MPITNITQPDKFSKYVNSHNNVLCLYYWKQCGYCQQFAPIWHNVTQHFADKMHIINVELDCIRKLEGQYQVSAFPTVVIFRNGTKHAEFNSPKRDAKNLHAFIQNYMDKPKFNPPVKKTIAKKQLAPKTKKEPQKVK